MWRWVHLRFKAIQFAWIDNRFTSLSCPYSHWPNDGSFLIPQAGYIKHLNYTIMLYNNALHDSASMTTQTKVYNIIL